MNIVAKREIIKWVLIVVNTLLGAGSAILHSIATVISLIISEIHNIFINVYMHGLIVIAPLPGSYTVYTTLMKTTGDFWYSLIIAVVIELTIGGFAYLIITALTKLKDTDKWWAFKVLLTLGIIAIGLIFWFVIKTDLEAEIDPTKSILIMCLPALIIAAVAISEMLNLHKKAVDFDTAFPNVNLYDNNEVVTYSDTYLNMLSALLNGPLSKSEIAKVVKVETTKILNKAGRGPLADAMNNGHVERIGAGIHTKYQLQESGKLLAMQN